jgi:hypothetical protein
MSTSARTSNWSAAGAGITGHPELMEALEASGAGTEMLGIEVPKRIAIDREGRVTDERPLRQVLTRGTVCNASCARPSTSALPPRLEF